MWLNFFERFFLHKNLFLPEKDFCWFSEFLYKTDKTQLRKILEIIKPRHFFSWGMKQVR